MKKQRLIKNLTALNSDLETRYLSLKKDAESIPAFEPKDTESEGYLKSNELQGDIESLLREIYSELEIIFDSRKDKDLDIGKTKRQNGSFNYSFTVRVKSDIPELHFLFKNIEEIYSNLIKLDEEALELQNYWNSDGTYGGICFNMFYTFDKKVKKVWY